MAIHGRVPVSFAVEGIIDQAVVLKLFDASGVVSGTPYVCDGIGNLRQRLDGFNAGARYSPWFVLCDLDRRECAPELRSRLFGTPQTEGMELSVAVRAVESWLMADRQSFATFLGVGVKRNSSRAGADRRSETRRGRAGSRVQQACHPRGSHPIRRRWSSNRACLHRRSDPVRSPPVVAGPRALFISQSGPCVRAMRDVLPAGSVVVARLTVV